MRLFVKSVWLPMILIAPLALTGFVSEGLADPAASEVAATDDLGGDTGNGSIIDERHDENEGIGEDDVGSAGGG